MVGRSERRSGKASGVCDYGLCENIFALISSNEVDLVVFGFWRSRTIRLNLVFFFFLSRWKELRPRKS